MLNESFQLSPTSIDTKKFPPAIETRQVAGQNITLATPRKVSFDSHHECRNINRSRNDSPTPPVCSLQSAICILYTTMTTRRNHKNNLNYLSSDFLKYAKKLYKIRLLIHHCLVTCYFQIAEDSYNIRQLLVFHHKYEP